MKTRKHQIGQIDGRPVWEVYLASDSKMEVTLISYGRQSVESVFQDRKKRP